MFKVKLTQLNALLDALAASYPVFAPIVEAGEANYGEYKAGAEVNLFKQTVKSAKDAFFPQSQDLMKFRTEGKKIDIIDLRRDIAPFVIFGVRACDVKSFEILDRVFLSEPVDTFYKARREKGVIVSLACAKPEESCFCTNFGIDATAPKGDDTTYTEGEYLYWIPNTDKGEQLTEAAANVLESADKADEKAVEEQKKRVGEVLRRLPNGDLDLSEFKPEKLNELFNDPDWDELSQSCLGCGSCTFVCPTCQCYDIRDFKTNDGVKRFRCWDSCMYTDFTKMAAVNSRNFQLQRFRQRFMHKLVYYPSNNDGICMCVGCGRCVKKCPISMNIVKVIKKVGGKKHD